MKQSLDLSDPKVYFGDHIPRILSERLEFREKLNGVQVVAEVEVTGEPGGIWHFVVNNSDISIHAGEAESPTFTVFLSIDTFRQLRSKTLAPQNAFLKGKIKLSGKVSTAMKLLAILRS